MLVFISMNSDSCTLFNSCASVICNNTLYAREQTGRIMYYTYYIILRIILYYVLSYPASSRTVDVIATSQYSDQ